MSSTTIEVAKYIHDLLYEYSSVIVPDLGAFSTRNKMANINEERQTIHPPIKTVVFNEKITINDGVLAGHISKMEAIPLTIVTDALKQFAADTKTTLKAGEAVPLGNLGTLQYQEGQGIEFYPTSNLNLSMDTFGLEAIELPTVVATTPPNSDEHIGAATVPTIPEVVTSLEEEKDLPIEEEIPASIEEKRTVSSVLAENVQNLPPVPPPERRRRSGGGWFWLLPLLILGLCLLLIMQLGSGGDKDKQIAENNSSNVATNTEENSSFWDFPPFNWFSGSDAEDKDALADNSSLEEENNKTSTSDSSTDNQTDGEYTNADSADGGYTDVVDASNGNGGTDDTDSTEDTADNTADTDENANPDANTDDTTTADASEDNTSDNSDSDDSSNTDTNTADSNTDSAATTESNASNARVTLTNTAALNGINVAEARSGEYVPSNSPKGYYIIVGAFKSKDNANKAVGKLKGKGYEASALQTTSGYYRVGIYGSTDGKNAKQRYTQARASENAKAWMLNYQ